jgi:hydroxyacylglutathione hydrolase
MKHRSTGELLTSVEAVRVHLARLTNILTNLSYSAHEYTASNAKFAASIEPGNADLMKRIDEIAVKRSRGEPTVPSMLGDEKKTNPFLRVDLSDEIRRNVGVTNSDSDADAFGKVRKAKDTFRG